MKLLVAIPSKRRAKILEENTLRWVKDCGFDFRVFVEKEDIPEYETLDVPLVALPESNRGLGFSKTVIRKYAEENGYDLIFKLDDDIRGFTNYRKRLKGAQIAVWVKMFLGEIVEQFEKYPALGVVSFPYAFQMFDEERWKKTKRVQTCYITTTKGFHADPAISAFEDFAVGLYHVVQGNLVVWYGMAGIEMGVEVGGGTGGHQSFDREERALKEVEALRKIYPPLSFRKVDKVWGIEPDLRSVKIGHYG